MTVALARVFEVVSGLPEDEQNRIAAMVLKEMEDAVWERSVKSSPERLREFSAEAHAEYLGGETELLDPDLI